MQSITFNQSYHIKWKHFVKYANFFPLDKNINDYYTVQAVR